MLIILISLASTVLNWVNEFKIWLNVCSQNTDISIHEISKCKTIEERAVQINKWHEEGSVLILGYVMFRTLLNENDKRIKKRQQAIFQKSLFNPGPDLVVCNEGHLLKNSKTDINKLVNRIATLRRIVLTGTPMQNNLNEYYCMINFIKPNLLGNDKEYKNRFVNPIENGQYSDSTEEDIKKMQRRSYVLHELLNGCVQRRDYTILTPFLPQRQEYVLYIRLTPLQLELYKVCDNLKSNYHKNQ